MTVAMSSTGEMRIEGSPPDSRAIIEATERLCPLVAIQPVYIHPLQRRHDGLAELKTALFAARLMKLDE